MNRLADAVLGYRSGRRDEGEAIRQAKRARGKLEPGFSMFVLLLALLGVIAAACTKEPTLWLLRGPAPLVVIFTVVNFIRQGYHRRDGLLVLGRATGPELSESTDRADEAEDHAPEIREPAAPARPLVLPRVSKPDTRGFRVPLLAPAQVP